MHESEKWKWSRSVVSDSSWPHGLQPTRLLCPWEFPGKNTGVGCQCLLLFIASTQKYFWFFYLNFYSEKLLSSLKKSSSNFVIKKKKKFYIENYSPAYRGNFISYQFVCLLSHSVKILLPMVPSIILNRNSGRWHIYLLLILLENISFIIKYDISCKLFANTPYQNEEVYIFSVC